MNIYFEIKKCLLILFLVVFCFQIVAQKEVINRPAADQKYWIDKRFYKFDTPWRKIHLDYHNSIFIKTLCEEFDAEKWVQQLLIGNVDAIVVFAKDMHGYYYYPSKYGSMHPGLNFDLLRKQIDVCKKYNIKVYGYYCTAWDDNLLRTHPEWGMLKSDGSNFWEKGTVPFWTALCLGNEQFVDWTVKNVKELVANYDLDGAWLDMTAPKANECYCSECVRKLKEAGKNPYDKRAQLELQNKNFLSFHARMREAVYSVRNNCTVDFNDIGLSNVSERKNYLDNIDVEALPTDPHWGYYYAPLQLRYQRSFGLPVYGMTGRFVSSWADFGGLKTTRQLDVELASLVANGARCDIGDQMPPNGKLDSAVYFTIGKSYGKIKTIFPYLDKAAPVTEAAMLITDEPLEDLRDTYLMGLTKLLIDLKIQFDVIEQTDKWERYNLIVIPDSSILRDETITRLIDYIDNGGAVFVSNHGGLNKTTKQSWLKKYGFQYMGDSEFKVPYLMAKKGFVDNEIPAFNYALYCGASHWLINKDAKSLAQLGEPLFNRTPEHYTSHKHAPFDNSTPYTALSVSNKVGLAGFPIGESYYQKGYWIYFKAFQNVLNLIYPNRLLSTNAPINAEITVMHQAKDVAQKRNERYLVHIINWSGNRKTPAHPEMHDNPEPLKSFSLQLNIPLSNVRVKSVRSGKALKYTCKNGFISFTTPLIDISEIIAIEVLK